MKKYILIISILLLNSCNEKKSQNIISDNNSDTIKADQKITQNSFASLLSQKINTNGLKLENKENLKNFNGFKGLKINSNFKNFIIDDESKIITDKNIKNHNFKEVQYIPKSLDIKSGRGNIMFVNLIFIDNILKEIEIHQQESWQISSAEYQSNKFSRGIKYNSFIEIFTSAFGKPDSFQYFIWGKQPQKMNGDFNKNLNEIDKSYNETQNNGELTSVDLEWHNENLSYYLSIKPEDINYLFPDSEKKNLSTSSFVSIQDIDYKNIINEITNEIAKQDNIKREKEKENRKIQDKKNSIQSL